MKDIPTMFTTFVVGGTAGSIIYISCLILYNVLFHQLLRYPGPFFAAATPLPFIYYRIGGRSVKWTQSLHKRYRSVVRLAPNDLSFIDADAWDDIYGYKGSSKVNKIEFQKGPRDIGEDMFVKPGKPAGLIRAEPHDHATQRRLFSPAFSDKELKAQEPLFQSFVDLLISHLRRIADQGNKNGDAVADMVLWYNITTSDIMADLTFGESLHMVERGDYSPWMLALLSNFRFLAIKSVSAFLAFYTLPICFLEHPTTLGKGLKTGAHLGMQRNSHPDQDHKDDDTKIGPRKAKKHMEFSRDRVDNRLAMKTDRPDIWSYILRHADSNQEIEGMSLQQMYANSATFMLAGTETTATQLAGLTYLLLKHPEIMKKLKDEIRSTFDGQEITAMQTLTQMDYLNACLKEGLRFYPPVAAGQPRITPEPGATVCGQYVPAQTIVSVAHYSAYHSPTNFHLPDEFHPERWLSEPPTEFANDQKHILQPFSYGPRNCIGKNLAFHEMRLILANVL